MRASDFDRAIHPHNVFGSIIGLVVVKTRKNAVRNLLDDQLIVGFTMFSLPENAMGMSLHVFNVALCPTVLLICERNGEAGFYSLCIHILSLVHLFPRLAAQAAREMPPEHIPISVPQKPQ